MNKLHTLILMCLLSLVGISANAQVFHPCDANHDGTVDVADIAITANYILTGEYQPDDPVTPVDPVVPDTTGNAVTTSIATNITSVSATLNAVVNIPQGVTIFAVSMIYSTDENPSETTGTVLDKRVEVDANTATEYAFDIAGLDFGTTYYYRAKLLTYPDRKTYYGDVMSFTTNDVNGKPGDMVDLGLPSGTMWAKCNLGAASAEQLGNLYAWGETTTKDSFSLDNYYYYFFGEYVNIGSDIHWTQYDAATASWKGAWRMPSTADFAELQNNCNWTRTTYKGVSGYLVKGNNGNCIFLPFNSKGFWSGNRYSTSQAYYMNCSSNSVSINSTGYRYTGKYIRPVQCPVQSVTLSADSTKIMIGKTFQLTATVTPSHAIQTVTWTSSDPSVATVSESGLVKGVGTGTAVITATTAEGGLTATCNVEVVDDPYNGHEYVDLGLSVKWATCNVGADSPEDYGNYYAWGETEPKDYYDWSTYQWCNGSYNTLTKYCTDSNYGTVDNKTVLDLEDDAAHVNWGGDWRMPTLEELKELRNNCTWKWTTQNGVKGYTVTSNINGNSIFLPAAGICNGGDVRSQGVVGNYWSSTPNGSNYACYLYFDSGDQFVYDFSRYRGYSVRAVCQDQDPSITLSADSTKLMIGKTFQLTVTGTPLHAIQTVTWTSSDPSVATVSESGLVKGVGTGTAVITATTAEGGLTATCNVEVFEQPDYNGHEYVDLGLSVKWATCNVGADSPEDYGDYFAWGETEPKDYYDWSTYKWCNGSLYNLTKYCTSSSYGTVDNKTVLELEDDAAHVNWGGDWRMPTRAEQDELYDNCTWEWTTQNGVKGYKVTSNINGNSIFLPAAGYRNGGSLLDVGSYGIYWSSSRYSSLSVYAYYLYFDSDYVDRYGSNRYYGLSVRAVCP